MKYKAILFISIFQSLTSFAQIETIDKSNPSAQIYNVEKEIFDLLYREQIDFIKLYNERTLAEAETLNEYCFNIIMHLRAGMPDRAIDALKEMKKKYPHIDFLSDLHYEIKQYAQQEVLYTLVSLYPIELELYLPDYLKYLYSEEKWSHERIMCWIDSLPENVAAVRINNPKQYDHRLHLKKDLSVYMGREKEFIIEIFDSIKNCDPEGKKVLIYLDVIINTNFTDYGLNLKRLSQYIKPKYSTDALFTADIFNSFNYYEEALHYYEIAKNTELTDYDYSNLNWGLSNRVSRERLKQSHEYNIIKQITDLMIKMGRNKEAHATMMKYKSLMDVGEKNNDFYYAGIIQSKTGIHKIERKLIRSKIKNRKNTQYWMNRSNYYEGRDNYEKADKAILKGIKLLKRKYSMDSLYLISDYEAFITCHHYLLGRYCNQQLAYEFYYKELKQVPLSSLLAVSIVHSISDLHKRNYEINVWDNIYWNYLKENDNWYNDLPSRLLTNCYSHERDSIFFRLKELAKNHPRKAYLLALNDTIQKYYPNEAIELLISVRNYKNSLKRETNWDEYKAKHKLHGINQLLANLYIQIEDLKSAELVLYEIDDMSFIIRTIEKIAILSYQKGNHQECFRLWSAASNINPSDMMLLAKFSNNTMNEYFLNFYKNFADLLPESIIPTVAFRIINQKTD